MGCRARHSQLCAQGRSGSVPSTPAVLELLQSAGRLPTTYNDLETSPGTLRGHLCPDCDSIIKMGQGHAFIALHPASDGRAGCRGGRWDGEPLMLEIVRENWRQLL